VKVIEAPSPNHDERPREPDMLVLHYTGMRSGEAALARLRDPVAKVSAHYLVEEDGRILRLVQEDRRAWHAGVSSWQGEHGVNGCSIGIEIVNPGHEFGYRDFPAPQVEAVISLLDDIRARWTIPQARIVGHADVAPERKEDPGERFPWRRLADAGHGLWADPSPMIGIELAAGEEAPEVAAIQAELAGIGYEMRADGRFGPLTAARVRAFQRHWAQQRVDGVVDAVTRARIGAISCLA
jgi:N-acetylmuramoyl-L-alanine amidase